VSMNGFTFQRSQLRTTGHEMGKINNSFDSEGEIPSKSDNWTGYTSSCVFTAAITMMEKSLKIDQQITVVGLQQR